MADIIELIQEEKVRLDPDCLAGLYLHLGPANAEDVVCRAVEELAVRLHHCEQHWRTENWVDLRKCARSMIAIAEQIGMTALARVAGDVVITLDICDMPAIGATLARLGRIGDRSLTAVWDQRDLSV